MVQTNYYNEKVKVVSSLLHESLEHAHSPYEVSIDLQLFLTFFHLLTIEDRKLFLKRISAHENGKMLVEHILTSYLNRPKEWEQLKENEHLA